MVAPLSLVVYPDLARHVEALERDGYAYFPRVLDLGAVDELRETMDRLEPVEAGFDCNSHDDGFFEKIINNAFNRDPLFLQYLDHPPIIELAETVHGKDAHVIGMTVWITGPGRPAQKLHTDWLPVSLPEDILADPRVKLPLFITTANFYLDDIYEALGPTNVIPGSHRAGRQPNPAETNWNGVESQSIICHAGDVAMFRCEIWHQGTANQSNEPRYLLQVHYAKRMITQKFPPYLNRFQFDPEILSRATPRQRRLMGEHRRSNYD